MTYEEKKEIIWNKVKAVLDKRNVDKSHYQYYCENLQPEAVEECYQYLIKTKDENCLDDHINGSISARELFWGLGQALCNYVEWESKQY